MAWTDMQRLISLMLLMVAGAQCRYTCTTRLSDKWRHPSKPTLLQLEPLVGTLELHLVRRQACLPAAAGCIEVHCKCWYHELIQFHADVFPCKAGVKLRLTLLKCLLP